MRVSSVARTPDRRSCFNARLISVMVMLIALIPPMGVAARPRGCGRLGEELAVVRRRADQRMLLGEGQLALRALHQAGKSLLEQPVGDHTSCLEERRLPAKAAAQA